MLPLLRNRVRLNESSSDGISAELIAYAPYRRSADGDLGFGHSAVSVLHECNKMTLTGVTDIYGLFPAGCVAVLADVTVRECLER